MVNVVADSEAFFKLGDAQLSVAVKLALAHDMEKVSVVFQLKGHVLQMDSGYVQGDLLLTIGAERK